MQDSDITCEGVSRKQVMYCHVHTLHTNRYRVRITANKQLLKLYTLYKYEVRDITTGTACIRRNQSVYRQETQVFHHPWNDLGNGIRRWIARTEGSRLQSPEMFNKSAPNTWLAGLLCVKFIIAVTGCTIAHLQWNVFGNV